MVLWVLIGCGVESEDCADATLTLEAIVGDSQGWDGVSGIACGAVYEARDDGISNSCGDTGLEEPALIEGTYAIWPSDWGLERRGHAVGVVVLDTDGGEVSGLPDVGVGDTFAVSATVRYGEVHDPCANVLFGSAWLELDAADVGL